MNVFRKKEIKAHMIFLMDDIMSLSSEVHGHFDDEKYSDEDEISYRFCNVLSSLDHLCDLMKIETSERPHWKSE